MSTKSAQWLLTICIVIVHSDGDESLHWVTFHSTFSFSALAFNLYTALFKLIFNF